MKKAQTLLETVQQDLAAYLAANAHLLPRETLSVPGKVSKGENYRGLPWLMLDLPRYFGKPDIMAVRSMFWWGHFFSITLHLAGSYKERYAAQLVKHYSDLCTNEYYYCVSGEQWSHHFEEGNYQPVSSFTIGEFEALLANTGFIKLSRRFLLSQWTTVPSMLVENFTRIVSWLD